MKVSFEFDQAGWRLTPRVSELFKSVKDKQGYLVEAMTSLQSKLNVLTKEGVIGKHIDDIHFVVEYDYPMGTEKVVLIAIARISGQYRDERAVVKVEFHAVMPDEYMESEHGKS